MKRFELSTSSLATKGSTTELHPHIVIYIRSIDAVTIFPCTWMEYPEKALQEEMDKVAAIYDYKENQQTALHDPYFLDQSKHRS